MQRSSNIAAISKAFGKLDIKYSPDRTPQCQALGFLLLKLFECHDRPKVHPEKSFRHYRENRNDKNRTWRSCHSILVSLYRCAVSIFEAPFLPSLPPHSEIVLGKNAIAAMSCGTNNSPTMSVTTPFSVRTRASRSIWLGKQKDLSSTVSLGRRSVFGRIEAAWAWLPTRA